MNYNTTITEHITGHKTLTCKCNAKHYFYNLEETRYYSCYCGRQLIEDWKLAEPPKTYGTQTTNNKP